MKSFRAICMTLALITAPAALASDLWAVREGPQGDHQGTWNVTLAGADVSGEAVMGSPHGGAITYKVAGRMDKGVYMLERLSPSDGLTCTYRGAPRPDGSIAGSATCDGQRGPWIVEPKKQ